MKQKSLEQSLEQLYAGHSGKVSDKWAIYLREYDRLFQEFRSRSVRLLEIGIQNGGSLEVWLKYFPEAATIIGCDIDAGCAHLSYDNAKISVVVGDANADATQRAVLARSAEFDLIIDDGSHRSGDIINSFARYFPCLREGGIFVIEDLHCSYWKEFEGGLFDPLSSMSFFKRLADVVNLEHWGVDKAPEVPLAGFFKKYGLEIDSATLRTIHSVEFVNSMCAIRKRQADQNTLGLRVIAGTDETVSQGHQPLHGTSAPHPSQAHNEWSTRDIPPDEELAQQAAVLSMRDETIARLEREHEASNARMKLLDDMGQLVGDMRLALASKDEQFARLTSLLGVRDQGLTDRDATIVALNLAMAALHGRIGSLDRTIADRDGHVSGLLDLVSGRDGQIDALSRVAVERDRQVTELTASMTKSHDRINELEQLLATKEKEFDASILAIADMDNRLHAFATSLASREARIAELELQAEVDRERIAELQYALAAKDRELVEQLGQAAERNALIESLHRITNERQVIVQGLAETIALNDSRWAEASVKLAGQDAQIESLGTLVGDLRVQISDRDAIALRCTLELEMTTDRVAVLAARVSEQEVLIETHLKTIRARNDQIGALNQTVKSMEDARWRNRISRYLKG